MSQITAVFKTSNDAEMAVRELRAMRIQDADISYVSRDVMETEDEEPVRDGIAKGIVTGAGIGALIGLSGLAIPGVGPFVAAGWLASTLGVMGAATATGAAVGGAAGALVGALANAGFTPEEAEYYGGVVAKGGVLLTVRDSEGYSKETVRDVLRRCGGMTYETQPV